MAIRIIQVQDAPEIGVARALFREYADSLGVDLGLKNSEAEVAQLPGDYAPPHAFLLSACENEEASGCVALRPLGTDVCEMKRLYVRGGFRGRNLGRALAAEVIRRARLIGFGRVRPDTLPSMSEARGSTAR